MGDKVCCSGRLLIFSLQKSLNFSQALTFYKVYLTFTIHSRLQISSLVNFQNEKGTSNGFLEKVWISHTCLDRRFLKGEEGFLKVFLF